jgi:hypothetical protein
MNLQTALSTEAQLAEEQRLEEQLNVEKLLTFRAGTGIPAILRTGRKHLMILLW